MRHAGNEPSRLNLEISAYLGNVLNERGGDLRFLEQVDPLPRGPRPEDLRQERSEDLAVTHAVGVGGEAGVSSPFRVIDRLGAATPLRVVAHGQGEVAIPGSKDLVGHDIGVLVAEPAGGRRVVVQRLLRQEVAGDVRQGGHGGVQQRDVQVLTLPRAFPRVKRREDTRGGVQPGDQIADRDADLGGRAVRVSGNAHQAAARLGEEVVSRQVGVRSRLPVAGNGGVDQPGVLRAQSLVIQALLRHPAHAEVLHHDVRLGHQSPRNFLPPVRGEIERDAALVAVEAEVVGALAGQERRSPGARVVTAAGPLDLDDVRAQVAEEHRA